jgi:hypothetical protein
MRLASPLLVALGVAVLLACDPLDGAELDCEEAVSVLADCCPGFDTSPLQCIVAPPQGCNGGGTSPALSQDDSACIRTETCAELISSGVCDRAQAARACTSGGTNSYGDSIGPTCSGSAVCP